MCVFPSCVRPSPKCQTWHMLVHMADWSGLSSPSLHPTHLVMFYNTKRSGFTSPNLFISAVCLLFEMISWLKQGSLINTLKEVQPTSHMGVPRVWEKIMEKLKDASAQSGFMKKKMLSWAMSLSLERNLNGSSRYVVQWERFPATGK